MILGYKSNHNVVYSGKYRCVWCPKYRRKVLEGKIAKRCEQVIRKTAAMYRAEIIALEIMSDHVHLLIEIDPQFGIHRLIKNIKTRCGHHDWPVMSTIRESEASKRQKVDGLFVLEYRKKRTKVPGRLLSASPPVNFEGDQSFSPSRQQVLEQNR